MDDPAHISFNILRTRVQKLQQDRNWRNVVVTSPTAGCGKTMVAVNLAFSLARRPTGRTVLVDLDLRKPSIAKTLGVAPVGSIGQFLQGDGAAENCFVQVSSNLIVGLNADRTKQSSELVQSSRMGELLEFVADSFAPDVVLFDLPPMCSSDDALAFLPRVDAALLVVAAGATTAQELDECEYQLSHLDKLLGIVINKSEKDTRDYYY
jgi:capsular exopolysaccharide synthesis family protein